MPIAFVRGDRRHKFNAQPIEVDGERFASTGEANRWRELCFLAKAGLVRELRRQVRFDLHAGSQSHLLTIGAYVSDFTYCELIHDPTHDYWQPIVEDFKGVDTPLSIWKRKHLEAEYKVIVKVTYGD
jgi:hypothetical protein